MAIRFLDDPAVCNPKDDGPAPGPPAPGPPAVGHPVERNEIERAVLRAFAFLSEDPAGWKIDADFVRPLKKGLALPEVRAWFSGGVAMLRESEIMDVEGEVHRPDLVVVREGLVEIIDFKVGNREEGHIEQVRAYMELLKAIFGGAAIKGFLLYLDEPAVVEVT
jgi:hypothetical protein